jgi:hypothetical protein
LDDCAEATPANDSVITSARKAPARIRRAIEPVMCTLSPSPKTRLSVVPSSSPMPRNPARAGTGPATRGHPSRIPNTRKVIPFARSARPMASFPAMSPTKIILVVT